MFFLLKTLTALTSRSEKCTVLSPQYAPPSDTNNIPKAIIQLLPLMDGYNGHNSKLVPMSFPTDNKLNWSSQSLKLSNKIYIYIFFFLSFFYLFFLLRLIFLKFIFGCTQKNSISSKSNLIYKKNQVITIFI